MGAQPLKPILTTVMLILGIGLIVLAGANWWRSPAPSPGLVSQGLELYKMSCAQCHGYDASGYNGPSLHNLTISDDRITVAIKKGIDGKMPGFGKSYDDRQIEALVSYLRGLR